MVRLKLLHILLAPALWSCGAELADEEQAKPQLPKTKSALAPQVDVPAVEPESPGPFVASTDAAALLSRYYAALGAGRYEEAWRLRAPRAEGRSATLEEFAASYARYAEYHASIGAPSQPVAARGLLYVEVPVHSYGRMRNGQPFSSAGTVTLRRAADGTAAEQEWRIVTD